MDNAHIIRDLGPFKMYAETVTENWRCDSAFTKEPETIAWINSFEPGLWFYDVGANVGLYSLYAASRGVKVVAFEPVFKNYRRLVENIRLNQFDIEAFDAALADQGFWSDPEWGNVVGESGWQLGPHIHDNWKAGNIWVTTIDDFWSSSMPAFPQPNYVKIDVDGQEGRIVRGMEKTLCRRELRSVLLEINADREWIFEQFEKNGFTTDNEFNRHEPHSRTRRTQEGISCENVVFMR